MTIAALATVKPFADSVKNQTLSMTMKFSLWACLLSAALLPGCGGGGGDPGECSGSAELCAEFGAVAGAPASNPAPLPAAVWAGNSGTGDAVFDIPTSVTRIRIQGAAIGPDANFVVAIGGANKINTTLGPTQVPTAFDGEFQLSAGGTVEITQSSGVSWRFSEIP